MPTSWARPTPRTLRLDSSTRCPSFRRRSTRSSGFFLTIFPIIVLASWVNMNVVSYNKSKEAKEADEKRKIRRAIKVDEKELEELEELDKAPAKRRKKRTAFEEALALEEKAEARKSFRLDP
mmetsp:Transcript_47529/g.123323  ORF Transcript_47529/g.123323 Transcript_47529/m.123323 type:complete len:122 (-) Transcript_47529:91-456(-)